MYSAPIGYHEIAMSENRIESVFMSMGIDIDNTAADDIASYTGDRLPMSSGGQLVDAVYEVNPGLATYEGDGIPTAMDAGMIVPPLQPTEAVRTGYWSESISESDGSIVFSLTVALRGPLGELMEHTSALTIYTAGPSITAGSVFFIRGGVETEVPLTCSSGRAVAKGSNTFDTVRIEVTAIDQPYKHLRLAEIEFGDSITVSMAEVSGEVSYIDEIDPLWRGLPMRELDFDLINVDGRYDEDNADGMFSRMRIGNPISFSFTIYSSTKKYTIPMGRFVMAEKRANGNTLRITAFDTRWYLSELYLGWTMSASESIGTALDRILTRAEVEHEVDADLFAIYPDADITFSDSSSVLDHIHTIAQAYGLAVLPNRTGKLVVGTGFASSEYGLIPPNIQFSWPLAHQSNRYNYIEVAYEGGTYRRDLREDLSSARITLGVSNPLITTQAQAEAMCNRLVNNLYTKAVTVRWAGDPAMDLYDQVDAYSQWTIDTGPTRYWAIKREIRFDGMMTETVTLTN